MKTIKFLPIFIGLLLFAACGDEEKEEVNDTPLYEYEVKDLPAVVVEQSHLDGYWIEVSKKEYLYTGKFQYIGDRIFYERMIETSTTYDINDFSRDYNGGEGVENALSSFVLMKNGDCDYMSQYRMYYLLDNSTSFSMRGFWNYLDNGIIHVVIVDKQQYSEDKVINIDYKIISFDGDEMTLRQMGEHMVVDEVFKRFDIERVNQVLKQEKETL